MSSSNSSSNMKQLQLQKLFTFSNPIAPYFLFEFLELWQVAFGPNQGWCHLDLNFILKFCTGPPISLLAHFSATLCAAALLPCSFPPPTVTAHCLDAACRFRQSLGTKPLAAAPVPPVPPQTQTVPPPISLLSSPGSTVKLSCFLVLPFVRAD
jgi:hypothetical protein